MRVGSIYETIHQKGKLPCMLQRERGCHLDLSHLGINPICFYFIINGIVHIFLVCSLLNTLRGNPFLSLDIVSTS